MFAQKKSDKPLWKQDTIIGTNIFRKHSNWLSGGFGQAKNSSHDNSQFVGGVDYNFHILLKYFQLGLFLSGDKYGTYNNYQFHGCYGKRIETTSINFAYFGGLSYSAFFERDGGIYKPTSKTDLGVYANAEFIKKIKYDVGIGASAFIDINSHQNIIGAKIDLYFSGAYKGKVE